MVFSKLHNQWGCYVGIPDNGFMVIACQPQKTSMLTILFGVSHSTTA